MIKTNISLFAKNAFTPKKEKQKSFEEIKEGMQQNNTHTPTNPDRLSFHFIKKSSRWDQLESEFFIPLKDKLLILIGIFIIPLLLNIVAAIAFKSDASASNNWVNSHATGRSAIALIIVVGTSGIGIYELCRHFHMLLRSGAVALIFFNPLLTLIFMILTLTGLFTNQYNVGTINDAHCTADPTFTGCTQYIQKDNDIQTIGMGVQTAIQIIMVFIVIFFSPLLRQQYRDVFTKHNIGRFALILVLAIATGFLLDYILTTIMNFLPGSKSSSKNEQSLDKLYSSAGGAILLGLSTIIAAPMMEELAMRHGMFKLSPNKIVGVICATLFFASMHVETNGDFIQIFGYLGISIACSLGYFFTDTFLIGWGVHAANNIVAFSSYYIMHR